MLSVTPIPADIASALWRGSELGGQRAGTVGTGFAVLDEQLPGGGWPLGALTEILQPQASVAEWRLLGAVMQALMAEGRDVVLVGPPKAPHPPGLRRIGLLERRLIWIDAHTPSERLWVTEQLVKANAAGVIVAWLPQARQEQIRRLQVHAQSSDGPVFLCRPAAAEHEASAAPLRLHLRVALDWALRIRVVKRRGPVHEGELRLASIPGGLDAVLTPRARRPSQLLADSSRQVPHAVGSTAPGRAPNLARATH